MTTALFARRLRDYGILAAPVLFPPFRKVWRGSGSALQRRTHEHTWNSRSTCLRRWGMSMDCNEVPALLGSGGGRFHVCSCPLSRRCSEQG